MVVIFECCKNSDHNALLAAAALLSLIWTWSASWLSLNLNILIWKNPRAMHLSLRCRRSLDLQLAIVQFKVCNFDNFQIADLLWTLYRLVIYLICTDVWWGEREQFKGIWTTMLMGPRLACLYLWWWWR